MSTQNSDRKEPTKRVMITMDVKDYDYCVSHFVKITPICIRAIKDYITWEKQKLAMLKKEIPANCDRKEMFYEPI